MGRAELQPTSDEFVDDILQPLPLDRFEEYRFACMKHAPQSLRGHHYLVVQERWLRYLGAHAAAAEQLSDRCKHRIYAHRAGVASNCTFFGISDVAKDDDDYIIFVFTLQESLSELDECVRQTKRINWGFGPLFTSIHDSDFQVVAKFMKANKLVWDGRSDWPKSNICMWYPKEKARSFEYTLPDDIYVAPLRPEHAKIIDQVWPHQSSKSVNYIRTILTMNNDGIGLFEKDSDRLLSWVFATENFTPGFLQCIDAAKGRGLGKLVMKIYCKQYAERYDLDLVAFIRTNNFISRKLFAGLGFEEYRLCHWCKVKTSDEYLK